MRYGMNRSTQQGRASRRAGATAILVLLALTVGCSKSEPAGNSTQDDGNPNTAAPVQARAVALGADGPTVDEAHPHLASAALVHARLSDLPDGTILQSNGVTIRESDINAEVARAPQELRDQLSKNAFFLLEQMATRQLLVQEARQNGADSADDEQTMLQSYFQTLAKAAKVSDSEIAEFYEQNREMVGGATLEQAKEQIRQYLLRQKQQQIVNQHIQTLAQRTPVVVSAGWVKTQAERAKDNPVDQARASGKPTFANFGAKGCVPCDMMEPIRQTLAEKYQGKLNIVFVHVGNEQILASRYGVQSIPLLIFFNAEGKEVFRHTGFFAQEQIEGKLSEMGVK